MYSKGSTMSHTGQRLLRDYAAKGAAQRRCTVESYNEQLMAINAQIDTLEARKRALLETQHPPWPKRVLLYASCREDSLWTMGMQLGLTGARLEMFAHFTQVALTVEVAEEGSVQILACDGKALQQ